MFQLDYLENEVTLLEPELLSLKANGPDRVVPWKWPDPFRKV